MNATSTNKKVLLTGITGFLGSHTAIQLLDKGYEVVGTLRSMSRAEEIRSLIGKHTAFGAHLSLVEADLNDEQIWQHICQGVDFIQHIASPFPRDVPKNELDLINPAKNGTLNVLKAAAANGIKRVVLTSSTGAIVYGKKPAERNGVFDETHWTDASDLKDTTPYFRSKTLAERAAWEFMEQDSSGLELVTICPGAILGPVLERDYGTSAEMIVKLMNASMPALPKRGFEIVDVRSVADLHIRAMELPQAANQRFAATAGHLSFKQMAGIVRQAYPNRKIPSFLLPNFAVKLFAQFDPSVKSILVGLGNTREVRHQKALSQLNWQPISPKEAVLSCAQSLVELGLV